MFKHLNKLLCSLKLQKTKKTISSYLTFDVFVHDKIKKPTNIAEDTNRVHSHAYNVV